MDYEKACKILGIDSDIDHGIDECDLKRVYRKKALLYHPDKNSSADATTLFQEIQESYDFLMKYENFTIADDDDDETNDNQFMYDPTNIQTMLHQNINNNINNKYVKLVFSFFKDVFDTNDPHPPNNTNNTNNTNNKLFYTILQKIATTCEKKALETLSRLDKTTLIKIVELGRTHKDVLHLSTQFVSQMEEMITDKFKHDECIILNPLLGDLFENHLYKMTVNGFVYVVPLWHNELTYDNSGCEIVVKCKPILPDNVEIDEQNNIHVKVYYSIQNIWDTAILELHLGGRVFQINTSQLRLTKEQTILFAGQGISRINTENVYDVSKLCDVYVRVYLEP